MPQKTAFIDGVGEITLVKRKGSRHLRLSIGRRGKVRVSLPYWSPYEAALRFALTRKDWIIEQLNKQTPSPVLADGQRIGKAHRLHFRGQANLVKPRSRITSTEIFVDHSVNSSEDAIQTSARRAAERALRQEAEHLLPRRLKELANQHDFHYRSVLVKKLTSRWGSCSNHKDIVLSFYLMQLPWALIDYVLIHELTHTKHLNHSKEFWATFTAALPNARVLQKEMRDHHPELFPVIAG